MTELDSFRHQKVYKVFLGTGTSETILDGACRMSEFTQLLDTFSV